MSASLFLIGSLGYLFIAATVYGALWRGYELAHDGEQPSSEWLLLANVWAALWIISWSVALGRYMANRWTRRGAKAPSAHHDQALEALAASKRGVRIQVGHVGHA
jgi:cytochrome bd-type quinol oxidase subunit 2